MDQMVLFGEKMMPMPVRPVWTLPPKQELPSNFIIPKPTSMPIKLDLQGFPFKEPVPEINQPDQLGTFLKSRAFQRLINFIQHLNLAVRNVKLSDACPESEVLFNDFNLGRQSTRFWTFWANWISWLMTFLPWIPLNDLETSLLELGLIVWKRSLNLHLLCRLHPRFYHHYFLQIYQMLLLK